MEIDKSLQMLGIRNKELKNLLIAFISLKDLNLLDETDLDYLTFNIKKNLDTSWSKSEEIVKTLKLLLGMLESD